MHKKYSLMLLAALVFTLSAQAAVVIDRGAMLMGAVPVKRGARTPAVNFNACLWIGGTLLEIVERQGS